MWIFVLEAMLALGLLLFIVWWTLGPTHRRERDELRRLSAERAAKTAEGTATRSDAENSPPSDRSR